MKGKILKYFSYRGYGFIETDDSNENIFFHISNYPKYQIPVVGQIVSFNAVETPKGKEATDINTIMSDSNNIGDQETIKNVSTTVERQPEEFPSSNGLDQIPGIGPKYEQLLIAAHVRTLENLAGYAPEILMANLLAVNQEENLTKRPPTLENVEDWIKAAKNMM